MKKTLYLLVAFLVTSVMYAQVPVTFNVDMSIQILKGNFVPGTDSVTVTGDFVKDAGGVDNWGGGYFLMDKDASNDSLYSVTVNMPTDSVGKSYMYKFRLNNDGWEGDPARTFVLDSNPMNLPVDYYNRDSVFVEQVTNTINFTADLTDIAGTGDGFFDVTTDSILVMGLDWDGLGTVVSGTRKMTQDPLEPGTVFKTTMVIKGSLADSTKWKFKAFPGSKFSNDGWETGGDRWITFQAEGTVVDLPTIVPRITPLKGPTSIDVTVLFQCDMGANPANRYDSSAIPLDQLEFIGLKGADSVLGSWGGNWVPDDTLAVNGQMVALNDAGLFGDKTAGDNIWSKQVTYPAGTAQGVQEYKFGAWYPAASSISASSPMDNEMGFGFNHNFDLEESSNPMELSEVWGTQVVTSVQQVGNTLPSSYQLSQNYPNPFNPTTVINYSIPEAGKVTLRVFNMLGQQVVTIVNSQQTAGNYKATFDAGRLASGIYFYTLSAKNFNMTKKMILMK